MKIFIEHYFYVSKSIHQEQCGVDLSKTHKNNKEIILAKLGFSFIKKKIHIENSQTHHPLHHGQEKLRFLNFFLNPTQQ